MHSNLLVVDSKKKEKGYRHLVNSNKIDWIESKMERRGRVRTGCGQKVFRWIFSQASWLLRNLFPGPAGTPAEESSSPSWEIDPIAFAFLADQLRDIESYDENLMITSSMPSNAEANSINID